jgi:predicted nucleic acid-binding protein
MAAEEARRDVRDLFHWLVPIEPLLILGAAQTMDCDFVLSEDMSAGQTVAGVRVVDPFRASPKDLDR